MKQKILVSFSAGETSAYMAKMLKDNYSSKYELIFVFANTSHEAEQTLIFAKKCDEYFGLNLIWVEAKVNKEKGKGTKHIITNFEKAKRKGEVFEDYIKKYGIPNMQNMTCTRELKERPITSYARSIGWKKKDYKTAIGIRVDEIDRISVNRKKNNLIYPLIEIEEITKQHVNHFWNNQPFRLKLKGYEGNCKTCWKKSERKLATISLEKPQYFDFYKEMELKYENHLPNEKMSKRLKPPIRFFRGDKKCSDIFKIGTEKDFVKAKDDKFDFNIQLRLDFEVGCVGSCEPFA